MILHRRQELTLTWINEGQSASRPESMPRARFYVLRVRIHDTLKDASLIACAILEPVVGFRRQALNPRAESGGASSPTACIATMGTLDSVGFARSQRMRSVPATSRSCAAKKMIIGICWRAEMTASTPQETMVTLKPRLFRCERRISALSASDSATSALRCGRTGSLGPFESERSKGDAGSGDTNGLAIYAASRASPAASSCSLLALITWIFTASGRLIILSRFSFVSVRLTVSIVSPR